MSAHPLEVIAKATTALGYRPDAVRRNYLYSDVWGAASTTRSVPLAAFTQTPPSYRSAAFAAVTLDDRDPVDAVNEHRALGAPLLFVIEENSVSTWQVYAKGPPRLLQRTSLEQLTEYFDVHREQWSPDAIHRAKAIGRVDKTYQLDFVDVGLVTAIEGEIHKKLSHLLEEALSDVDLTRDDVNIRTLFQGVFRLLAAKILMDRRHKHAGYWDNAEVETVLAAIGDYYNLKPSGRSWSSSALRSLQPVWLSLCRGLNVANISADDLAFVYEHALVTPQARKEFGTHSTPRHVADYVVSRLRLWEYGSNPPKVFEPFTGAGVFLVSALRYLKDGLPHRWKDERRHNLLVRHIKGAEIDPFACEVAKLSLILADYPSANGWVVDEANLFKGNALRSRIETADVVLCNPPFESFSQRERGAWPGAADVSPSKAIFALETALRAKPKALGFVVPRALLVDRRYRDQRITVEQNYREVELVSLPDGVFNVSQADTALLIARDFRRDGDQVLRSSEVLDGDKKRFALTGAPSVVRELSRDWPSSPSGAIWLTPLAELWTYLSRGPRLGELVEGHWGLRWKSHQSLRSRSTPKAGWARGILNTFDHRQYELGQATWLDTRPAELYVGNSLDWNTPKILCNAGRLSRKYWRLAAAVDRQGLVASQQFIGLWPKSDDIDLDAVTALLNGPVINAYLAEHSFDKRFRIRTLLNAPVPREIPADLGELSREFSFALQRRGEDAALLRSLLSKIDAATLSAYHIPTSLEQELLSAFKASARPITLEKDIDGQLSLAEDDLFAGAGRENERRMFDYFGSVERSVGSGPGAWLGVRSGTARLNEYAQRPPVESWAGEVATAQEVARRLDVPIRELKKWKQRGLIVSLAQKGETDFYPIEQFHGRSPIDGLKAIVDRIGDARSAWLWLRQPHGALNDSTPLQALRGAELARVDEVARRDFD